MESLKTTQGAVPKPARVRSIEDILAELERPRFPKVDELLGRVFAASQFQHLSILELEQAVLGFLSDNRDRWQAMLNGEGLFSQQTVENIDAISIRCALERTNRKLVPSVIEEVRKLDFRYIEIMRNAEGLSESMPLDLIDITIRSLKRLSGRIAFMGPYEVIRSDLAERYIVAVDEESGTAARKAIKPLKKHLNLREINHCVKSALLIRNAVYLQAEPSGENGFSSEVVEASIGDLHDKYPLIPRFLLKMGLYANLRSDAAHEAPGVSRLIALFSLLGQELLVARREHTEPEGLEHGVLRAIAEELGDDPAETVDGVLLEELTEIAAGRGW